MKTSHENILLIENWIDQNSLAIELTDEFVINTYNAVLKDSYNIWKTSSKKKKKRFYSLQYHYVRRDLLKILYKKNSYSAKDIKAGFVYAITNPAWPGYVKIGSAIDVYDRLNSYQTSSPHRDYELIGYVFSHNRLATEKEIQNASLDRQNEWCKYDAETIKLLFRKINLQEFNHMTFNDV